MNFGYTQNMEAYQEGLYYPSTTFLETPITRLLNSDGTGMWLISTSLPKIKGLFEGGETIVYEIFHEDYDGSKFNKELTIAENKGFTSLAFADSINIKARGCYVSKVSVDGTTLNGLFKISAKFQNDVIEVATVTKVFLMKSSIKSVKMESFSFDFEVKITMNSVELALLSLKVYNGTSGFEDPTSFEINFVEEILKPKRRVSVFKSTKFSNMFSN